MRLWVKMWVKMSSGGEGRGKRKGDALQVPNEIRASKKPSQAGPSA